MTTNEILFWSLVIVTWVLSLAVAYFYGVGRGLKKSEEMLDQTVNRKIREKLDEIKKQPPIR